MRIAQTNMTSFKGVYIKGNDIIQDNMDRVMTPLKPIIMEDIEGKLPTLYITDDSLGPHKTKALKAEQELQVAEDVFANLNDLERIGTLSGEEKEQVARRISTQFADAYKSTRISQNELAMLEALHLKEAFVSAAENKFLAQQGVRNKQFIDGIIKGAITIDKKSLTAIMDGILGALVKLKR